MKAQITPFRVAVGLLFALFVTVIILLKTPTGYYLYLPDGAHPVAPLVRVAGGKPPRDGGNLYFVDVQEQRASEFDILFQSWLHPHSTKIPAKVATGGASDAAYLSEELRQMSMSQRVAAAVALRHLHYRVVIHTNGVLVNQLFSGTDAVGKLHPTDVIVAVNGHPTPTLEGLHIVMKNVKPGDMVKLRVINGEATRDVQIRTTDEHGRAFIGIVAAQSYQIGKLPLKVSIDAGGIGGPSAGLAFTLEVMRRLGYDVTHGYRVAATGAINADGSVGAIGGVKQKTWGVRDAGAQVFLVPVDGGNAKEAEKYAGPNLKIVPVTSLDQALRALAALPKLR